MRIHTSLSKSEIYVMIEDMPGVSFGVFSKHGSRKRDRAFEIQLRGNSSRSPNSGRSGSADDGEKAATWDEWGIFLNRLFEADDEAVTPYYTDVYDFHRQTGYRFKTLAHADQHKNHKFLYQGMPKEHSCKCGAVRRW